MNTLPFHPDELIAQQKAGVEMTGTAIRDYMPDQHRLFFASLRYILVSVVDADGWPVAAMLSGEPGFVSALDAQTLRIALSAHDRVVTAGIFSVGQEVGLLGIELTNRRRNRANGHLDQIDVDGVLTIAVNQSFGNCPQYIQRRSVQAVAREAGPVELLSQLDAPARALIAAAETFFVASRARAGSDTSRGEHGGADISHRGGQPGFVHIEGNDLWVPDFSGNNYFNTLGNLLGEPRAALLFIDFESGGVLHLQGEVEIYWHSETLLKFTGAERLWRFRVQRGWRQRAALPLRWTYIDAAPSTGLTGSWAAQQ